MPTSDDQAEAARRRVLILNVPPCDEHFYIHYRDNEPVGLLIDGQAYSVRRLAEGGRGTGVRDGDWLMKVADYQHPV